MSRALNHTGIRYGKIVGIKSTGRVTSNKQLIWVWKCDCGTEFESPAGTYVSRSYSGGCPDCSRENRRILSRERSQTHGMSRTKEHKSWCKIKERCFNVNDKEYINYGAKGITMHPEWKYSFEKFIAYIGLMPMDGSKYSCDRIDNDKGYEPGNVRWATYSQQARNKGKMKSNTSGVTGVSYDDKLHPNGKDSTLYCVASWTNLEGKFCKKCYSLKKYGEELAFFLACEKRELEIQKLNLLGAGYSDKHGK